MDFLQRLWRSGPERWANEKRPSAEGRRLRFPHPAAGGAALASPEAPSAVKVAGGGLENPAPRPESRATLFERAVESSCCARL